MWVLFGAALHLVFSQSFMIADADFSQDAGNENFFIKSST
jgi:hypothetical protein